MALLATLRAMTISPASKPALERLRTIEFGFQLKGYKIEDVDEYLELVTLEVDALRDQNRSILERLRQASEHIASLEQKLKQAGSGAPEALAAAPVQAVPEAAPAPAAIAAPVDEVAVATETQRTLIMAQRFVEQTEREAQEAAARKIADAEETARRITVEAELKVREEVSRLESVKGQLATEIDGLSSQLDSERVRLTSQLQEVLRWIDTHVKPSEQIRALRSAELPTQAVATTPAVAETTGQIFNYGDPDSSAE